MVQTFGNNGRTASDTGSVYWKPLESAVYFAGRADENMRLRVDSMGYYFDLPDENRTAELLMQIAAKCLEQGIPQQIAINMTMCHPVFNTDKLLVEKTFENVYMVQDMEEYHRVPSARKALQEQTSFLALGIAQNGISKIIFPS